MTLRSLLLPSRRADIGGGQYYVCTNPQCETVYFGPGEGGTFLKSDLAVRFGLKETSPPRPVCYCFGHTVEEIHEEIRRTGRSTVVDRIRADMKSLGCRCEYTNPQGGCCLRSVQDVVAEGLQLAGRDQAVQDSATAEQEDCCATAEYVPRASGPMDRRATRNAGEAGQAGPHCRE